MRFGGYGFSGIMMVVDDIDRSTCGIWWMRVEMVVNWYLRLNRKLEDLEDVVIITIEI